MKRKITRSAGILALSAAILAGSGMQSGNKCTVEAKTQDRTESHSGSLFQVPGGLLVFNLENPVVLMPGQTLRIGVGQINPGGTEQAEAKLKIEIYREQERAIKVYDLIIPRDQFRWEDIPRSDLDLEGEQETEPIEIRVRIAILATPGSTSLRFAGSVATIEGGGNCSTCIDVFFSFGCNSCPPAPLPNR